ncbi:MAG: hypothetical protein ACLQMT_03615 [Candidatus Acidiferrales bacterium]
MGRQEYKLGLIHSRLGAVIALCLTGYVAALSFRAVFSHHRPEFHWLILKKPLDFGLPTWALAAINLAFYAYLIWVGVLIYRMAQGKERILVAGWLVGFLWPIEYLSMSAAAVIRCVDAAGMLVALVAAVYIFMAAWRDADGAKAPE